ncbi:MAG: hypothetical protein Q9219_001595 [cf. Caloplaca sp. 3 TL-2023]
MPPTDPTFQHSDEDWTQITQPRLRKRVQNRVSQRKHRNKIRQQRANSIDTGQAAPAPVPNATGYWPPAHPLPSNGAADINEHQHRQPHVESPKQTPLDTTLFHGRNDFDAFAYNGLDDYPSWTGDPGPVYPQTSAYPTISPYAAHDGSQLPTTYAPPAGASSKGPPVPSLSTYSVYDNGLNTVETTPYEYLQYLQKWYPIPPTFMSPSSFGTRDESAGPSPLEQSQQQAYDAWQPARACDIWSSAAPGPSPLIATKPLDLSGNGYYVSSRTSSVTGRSDNSGISTPIREVGSSSNYIANRTGTALAEDVASQGSGVNPANYKSGKRYRLSSRPK